MSVRLKCQKCGKVTPHGYSFKKWKCREELIPDYWLRCKKCGAWKK